MQPKEKQASVSYARTDGKLPVPGINPRTSSTVHVNFAEWIGEADSKLLIVLLISLY